MANTLKFGNENWATKKDSILAYNDENANFKPLPFVTSRASTATRVNKLGLIETVASGIPRVDYLGNTKGAYLLEPQSTNLIAQSEAFTNRYWTKSGVSIVGGFASPSADSPLGAYLMQLSNTGGNIYAPVGGTGDYTFSVYAKYKDAQFIRLRSTGSYAYFDIQNGVIGSAIGTTDTNIEALSNGWYKCSVTGNNTNSLVQIFVSNTDGSNTGTGGVYLFGAQLEQSSYPTSYIPTNGSTVTRLAESCSQTPPDGVIGQTEGVLFIDVTGETQVDAARYITIGNIGDTTNRLIIYQYSNLINVFSGAGATFNITYNPPSGRLKMALAYSVGDYAFYVNGVQVFTNDNNAVPACSEVSLGMNEITSAILAPSIGYNDVGLYNTRLSNTELVTLTTI